MVNRWSATTVVQMRDVVAAEDYDALLKERETLRAALVALIGVDGRTDLEQMEAVMRLTPAPAEDKAAMVDAIHALILTLPNGTQA